MSTPALVTVNPLVETRVPALPQIGAVADPAAKSALEAIINIMRVREGVIGDPLDQAVTFRDFYKNAGMPTGLDGLPYFRNRRTGNITFLPANEDASQEFAPPPAVTNLAVVGALANFIITFNEPQYNNHAYTEIWRSGTNDLGAAVMVGTTNSSVYADNVGATSALRYYWVRNVSTANVQGPFNAVSGVSDTTDQVETTDIANAAITNAKIGALAVDTANIAAAAIVTAKIADAAITNAKIASAAITNAKIGTAEVGTLTIAGNAVTVPVLAYTSGSITVTAGVQTTLQSAGITTSGGSVLLIAQARMINANNDTAAITISDSSGTPVIINSIIHSAGYDDTMIVCYVDTPAAGTYTYYMKGTFVTNNGSAEERLLFALEIKR